MPIRAKRIAERGSVKFHSIGDTTFWLTPSNRIFFIDKNEEVHFPFLRGGVKVESTTYVLPEPVKIFLDGVLHKQREVRFKQRTEEIADELSLQSFT